MGVLSGRFPTDISRGAEGGHANFDVAIVMLAGGQEVPNLNWDYARGRWNVARVIEATNSHLVARRHFIKARGRFHYFRFKDPFDYLCSREGDDRGRITAVSGGGGTLQINKVYGADEPSFEYVRPLTRIVALTELVWHNGTPQTRGSDYTIDNDTGIITPGSAWDAEDVEVQCEFDCLCRYDTSGFNVQHVAGQYPGSNLLNWANIDIIEVREPEVE